MTSCQCHHHNIGCSRIEIVEHPKSDHSGIKAWNEVLEKSVCPLPMLSHAWVSSFFEKRLQPFERGVCVFAYVQDEMVGVLPLIKSQKSIFGISCWQLHSPYDDHTYMSNMIVKRGYEDSVADALLNASFRVDSRVLSLALRRVVKNSPILHAINSGSAKAAVVKHVGLGSFIDTTGSFSDYKASLTPNFKGNLRKATNKFLKLKDTSTRFISSNGISRVELQSFFDLESSGWKGREGSAIKCSADLTDFYTSLAYGLKANGWLELDFLLVGDRPIAAHFGVLLGRTLYLLKIAYDEEYAYLAPGNLLFLFTLERAFSSADIDEVNCISDMPWHNNWKLQKREFFDVYAYPNKLVPYILRLRQVMLDVAESVPIMEKAWNSLRSELPG